VVLSLTLGPLAAPIVLPAVYANTAYKKIKDRVKGFRKRLQTGKLDSTKLDSTTTS